MELFSSMLMYFFIPVLMELFSTIYWTFIFHAFASVRGAAVTSIGPVAPSSPLPEKDSYYQARDSY